MTGGTRDRRHGWRSFRTRITVVITIVAAAGMLAVGTVVYAVERSRILASVDDRLEADLEYARFLVAEGQGTADAPTPWPTSRDALNEVMTRMNPDSHTGALGIVGGEPAFIPGLDLDLDLREPPGFAAVAAARAADGPVIATFDRDGRLWRYLAVPIEVGEPAGTEAVVFVMAYDLAAELAEFDTPAGIYLIAAGIAIVVIAGAAVVVATHLLRPLRRMRETAERVSAQSLSERLPVQGRDEVSELAATMNDMLDRIDDALDSQRRLLSDVGHELKTPITIVRGVLEVMDADDPADVRGTRADALDELERMSRLMEDLAHAAALHGPAPIDVHPVDAADLMAQIVRKAEAIQGAEVSSGGFADVAVRLDPARITQAMLQLAQNGVTHGGGRLVIGSRVRHGALELWVRDHGPGVPDDAKLRVFERFQRGPRPSAGGHGLGLNIVQVIARAHGGTAVVRDAEGAGAEFVIALPYAGTPGAAGAGGSRPAERREGPTRRPQPGESAAGAGATSASTEGRPAGGRG